MNTRTDKQGNNDIREIRNKRVNIEVKVKETKKRITISGRGIAKEEGRRICKF
jgi:hypothetical protein